MGLPLRIKMFGPFHVWREGETEDSLSELRARKMAMRLLALLALYPNRALDKSEATTLLWGGGHSESNLDKTCQTLCRTLGPDGGRVSLVSRAVRLDLSGVDVDLGAFDLAWEERGRDLAPLQAAIDACDGPLLQGWDDPWVEQARARATERCRRALHLLAEASIGVGRLRDAQHYLGCLRRAGDCADTLHTRLMEAWMALKAYPGAKQCYEEYRDYLRHEQGLLPSETITQMYHNIPSVGTEFEPPVKSLLLEIEAPGGAMSVGSRFYVERPIDRDFHAALARRDGTILINGPRQVGKSSLMARGIEQGRQAGLRVVTTDFQRLNAESLGSIDTFYRAILRSFQRKLSLATRPGDYWDVQLSPNENFEGYLQDIVLTEGAPPLIWCIDEADRIFDRGYRASVFGLLRSWHNARAEGAHSPWSRFLLVMAYSTEAHLFIPNLNQSPFNVGTKVTLEDFSPEQIQELNLQHGSPISSGEEVAQLFALVGGHPYLVRLCFYEIKAHGLSIADLVAEADQDFGLFRDHLEHLCGAVMQDAQLATGVRSLLGGEARLSQTDFVRLRSAGVMTGKSFASARLRCGLYARYFTRRLS